MLRTRTILMAAVPVALMAGGCALFAPHPAPPPREAHVIIAAADGLKASDINPAATPLLSLLQRDGTCTWNAQTSGPASDRASAYAEALMSRASATGPRTSGLFDALRRAGQRPFGVVRTAELAELDPAMKRLDPDRFQDSVSAGSYAAEQFLRFRPTCLFVELSSGKEKAADCEAGLAPLFAAVNNAGLAERTTVIVLCAGGASNGWVIRGPEVRRGHELAGPISMEATAGAALYLLAPGRSPLDLVRVPAGAFRALSREPASPGERTIACGSIRGRVLDADGRPMPRASVLLVRNEPVDGILERWADATVDGEFRFDSIPADTYDYAFVFDNLPCRLRRSLLVATGVAVTRDTTARLTLQYQRIQGPDRSAASLPAADTCARLLTREQVRNLVRLCREGGLTLSAPGDRAEPVVLASDALSGSRAHTALIRDWFLTAAKDVDAAIRSGKADPGVVERLTDLAVAYDLNQCSGLLTNTEERSLRTTLANATDIVNATLRRGQSEATLPACVALAATAGALGPSRYTDALLEDAETLFAGRFDALLADAEARPARTDYTDVCHALAYALMSDALDSGAHIDARLERLVDLSASCLTPAERRVSPAARTAAPRLDLGFLGLAKSAFEDEESGRRFRALWELCGSPVWATRGTESLAGILLTAAGQPRQEPAVRAKSARLTDSSAVLRDGWQTPGEWFIYVNGWRLDVYARAAKLASVTTPPPAGTAFSAPPRVVRFRPSPGCDYVLLRGSVSRGTERALPAWRHVLFNKLTGYLVVWDEFPAGVLPVTEVVPAVRAAGGTLVGDEGVEAQVLALAADATASGDRLRITGTSSRPMLAICLPPAGAAASVASLGTWDVTLANLARREESGFGGAHVVLRTDHGPEFIYLARTPSHVEGNLEDVIFEGTAGLVRQGKESTDFVLIDGQWAQSARLMFRLDRGQGYVTVQEGGRADGWSKGSWRRGYVSLGEGAPQRSTLTVDGVAEAVERVQDRAIFTLPDGAHVFRIR